MTLSLLKGQLSVVIFFVFLFSLFTIHSLFTNEVLAAPGDAPNPKPCENALNANYTMNALDPISFTVSETASPGTEVTAEKTVYFNVDFSKLQAVFGKPSSDYLESRFQDEPHREIDILSLESADFNKFHGPNQKITPKSLIDPERVKYVEDVYNKPELAESANKFSDINGENPHTIYELIHDLGFPYPPNPPEGDEDRTEWLRTWGRYWEKIPTAVSEFNYGRLLFLPVSGQSNIQQHEQGQAGTCPIPLRTIYFVLPEFARTTSISSQANRVVVPKAAQSVEKSLLAKAGENTKEAFSKITKKCFDAFLQTPLSKVLKKAVKITLNFLGPVKIAYAKDPACELGVLPDDKKGTAPFCALPAVDPDTNQPQLQAGDICRDVNDPNKLDKNNPNVNCTFKLDWTRRGLIIGQTGPEQWDRCDPVDEDTGEQTCYLDVKIWPTFLIPWLAEIWNNTTYSDEDESNYVLNTKQKTGKPGVYTLFKPKSTDETVFPKGKNLPGKQANPDPNDLKQRFLGASKCNLDFDRDIALKPKALQEANGIQSAECNLLAAVPPGPGQGGGPEPPNVPPNSNDCSDSPVGPYELTNPLGNFGDPNCDFSISELADLLDQYDPANALKWIAIIGMESGYNPNSYNPGSTAGQAFGLVQMGHAAYPEYGLDYQIADPGTEYDRGDVEWHLQVYNAIHYNNEIISGSFCYWEAAIILGIARGC
ncbi:hypothetical protein A2409_00565 [Candidatus Curtissbacteria bacterium RIFOXYC1_FULL_41_36]|nr:MAG: hypothetical protein UT95_C0010G0028 [Candidatus Curtissbacteria bacterium GW2011_GWB1_40_28]KKR60608.1 MAG: hypothetical protein UT99_C0011G0016 [Candidatus Curtissbacteria bacterium GW2011_GWA2_40_31]KKS01497.1 MAG: hypothetical protein UU53_C0011G0002 [Candidatus Curtissbacteria bacterium GW2011_GWC2_41_21]OGE15670.1 MAG: hypothetical protein A2409_00565 [Candidatus Curtissbacteria bacterium RIFOXYC1_FULL_41_36]